MNNQTSVTSIRDGAAVSAAGTTATAVVYEAPRTFSLRELPLPEVGPDDVLLEVTLCGVDGSELHMFNGELEMFNGRAPLIFGDEIVGRIAAIGEAAREERGLDMGDFVTVESRWPCPEGCRHCDRGQYFICLNNTGHRGYGSIPLAEAPSLWGGYASHVYVPRNALLYRIPPQLSERAALFACSVLANGLRWTEVSGAGPGKTVVVIGPGPQGLASVLAAVRAGSAVVSVGLERDAERLAAASSLGAAHTVAIAPGENPGETAERIRALVGEVDIVIEGAGFAPAKQLAYEVVSPLGTVTNVAVASPIEQPVNFQQMLMKEIKMLNPMSHPHTVGKSLDLAVELLENGLDVGRLVTHEFALRDAAAAIDVAANRTEESPIKVVLNPAL
ncbi:zinc-dependent alcohol dehydrogenase [Arthrobacter mobilis]|uniref:Alcohol dehydrogenase catalytic domain-containing protein n=1 Tax=Arthrobacter mobilis TaxID=2724944 RepID=A0A7X6QMK6_9MICC|nr:zinc-binding dehydrogenase [Arthrobacter mobilis]NKX56555.1 alcohol dehydrogenase catalytic domain-containing protein [Arthrobacter mobilis]